MFWNVVQSIKIKLFKYSKRAEIDSIGSKIGFALNSHLMLKIELVISVSLVIVVVTFRRFHQHYTRAFFVRIFCQNQNVTRNVTREKLPNQCLYEKFVRKIRT